MTKAYHFNMIFFNNKTGCLQNVLGTFVLPSPEEIEECKNEILKGDLCLGYVKQGYSLLSFNYKLIPETIAPMNKEE